MIENGIRSVILLQRETFSFAPRRVSPPTHFPVALMRLAREGSVSRVTLTVMPGFKSATTAFRPFTLISVNCVIVSVFVTLSSATVIEVAVTLEITGGCCTGAGADAFFLEPAKLGLTTTIPSRTAITRRRKLGLFTARYFLYNGTSGRIGGSITSSDSSTSSVEFTGWPPGFTRRAVTKMTRLRLMC
jgi:hypothetical protein